MQVTPKSVVRSGRNSNLSGILCLSRLHESSNLIDSIKPNKTKQQQKKNIYSGALDKVKYSVFGTEGQDSNSDVNSPI